MRIRYWLLLFVVIAFAAEYFLSWKFYRSIVPFPEMEFWYTAVSSFLRDVLDRILNAIPHSAQAQAQAFANSFVLSADNAHAVHPNFADKADPCNKVILGKGVVVKVNASQKYTTSGLTGAIFKEICRKNNVPVQVFANRADLPGGSTLGNLAMAQVSMNCVDIGLPQLAMHSCYETAGAEDTLSLIKLMQELYSSHFEETAFGTLSISK